MPLAALVSTGRSFSAGALLAVGGGLALYQLTSLVLGPASARQVPLSLSLPAADVEELAQPAPSHPNLILGTLSPAPTANAASANHLHLSSNAGGRQTRPATPTPAVTTAPIERPRPLPPVRPTPPAPPMPASGDD